VGDAVLLEEAGRAGITAVSDRERFNRPVFVR
jgi:hypothetical protein